LLVGDGDTLRRRGNRGGDHRPNGVREPGNISLSHFRQPLLQGDHVVAEQMSKWRIQC